MNKRKREKKNTRTARQPTYYLASKTLNLPAEVLHESCNQQEMETILFIPVFEMWTLCSLFSAVSQLWSTDWHSTSHICRQSPRTSQTESMFSKNNPLLLSISLTVSAASLLSKWNAKGWRIPTGAIESEECSTMSNSSRTRQAFWGRKKKIG